MIKSKKFEKGKTIILVSHGLDTVQELCERSLLLNHGLFDQLVKLQMSSKNIIHFLKLDRIR